MEFVLDTVNHVSEYVRDRSTLRELRTSGSLLKRGLRGTYVSVEPFHLDRYIAEQVFRYNNRATEDNPLNDSDRFMLAMSPNSWETAHLCRIDARWEKRKE